MRGFDGALIIGVADFTATSDSMLLARGSAEDLVPNFGMVGSNGAFPGREDVTVFPVDPLAPRKVDTSWSNDTIGLVGGPLWCDRSPPDSVDLVPNEGTVNLKDMDFGCIVGLGGSNDSGCWSSGWSATVDLTTS